MNEIQNSSVLIVGLGLMGGSVAWRLQGKCQNIFAIDINKTSIDKALLDGVIQDGATKYEEINQDYDLVIIALPVCECCNFIRNLPSFLPSGSVILDLGSTKKQIVEEMNKLPHQYFAIGGHPICGKENSSYDYSDGELFRGSKFILVETDRSTDPSKLYVENFVRVLGAEPIWMAANEHDDVIALTSHLPYLLSNILADIIPTSSSDLIGSGLNSAIRLAGSDVDMFIDILISNRENILTQIRAYSLKLSRFGSLLQDGEIENIKELLNNGRNKYTKLYKKDV